MHHVGLGMRLLSLSMTGFVFLTLILVQARSAAQNPPPGMQNAPSPAGGVTTPLSGEQIQLLDEALGELERQGNSGEAAGFREKMPGSDPSKEPGEVFASWSLRFPAATRMNYWTNPPNGPYPKKNDPNNRRNWVRFDAGALRCPGEYRPRPFDGFPKPPISPQVQKIALASVILHEWCHTGQGVELTGGPLDDCYAAIAEVLCYLAQLKNLALLKQV